jgi:membrane protein
MRTDPRTLPAWQAGAVRGTQLVYAVVRDITQGPLTLEAMGLVYTTLLSLVPLLAFSFSALKGFGVHNQLEPLLQQAVKPLGASAGEVVDRLVGFVDRMDVSVLGAVGLGMLIYTVISLMQKIERALNDTWRVSRPRRLSRRFSDYLSVLLVGPVLAFAAVGMTRRLSNLAEIQPALAVIGSIAPFAFLVAAFALLYLFMPNTRVRLTSAMLGGAVAAGLWVLSGSLFAFFVASSAQYQAIYSAFAAMVLFIIWLYVTWMIVLVGAAVAYYHQHPEAIAFGRAPPPLCSRERERLALLAAALVSEHYYARRPPWTRKALAAHLGIPEVALASVITDLCRGGLIAETADLPPALLPARPPDTTSVAEVVAAVRGPGPQAMLALAHLPEHSAVDNACASIEKALSEALGSVTVKELAASSSAERAPGPFQPVEAGRSAASGQ